MKTSMSCCAIILILIFPGQIIAQNDAAIKQISDEIDKTELPDYQKKAYKNFVQDYLSKCKKLDLDKQKNAGEHFRVYMNGYVNRSYSEQDVNIVLKRMHWDFTRFINASPIDEKGREVLHKRYLGLQNLLGEVIDLTYAKASDEVKKSIREAISKRLNSNLPKIGNYFYPESLVLNSEIDVDVKVLSEKFPVNHGMERYDARKVLFTGEMSDESRARQIAAFAKQETSILMSSFAKVHEKIFDTEKGLGGLDPSSEPRLDEFLDLMRRNSQAVVKEGNEVKKKIKYEDLTNNILNGSGIVIKDGEVSFTSDSESDYILEATMTENFYVNSSKEKPKTEKLAAENAEIDHLGKQNNVSNDDHMHTDQNGKINNWPYFAFGLFLLGGVLIFVYKRIVIKN